MSQTNNINDKKLADINKEIFEFKKKIQLSGNTEKLYIHSLAIYLYCMEARFLV